MAKRPQKKSTKRRRGRPSREDMRVAAAVQHPDETRLITAENLKELLTRLERMQIRRSNATSEIGATVSDATERQGLHRKAFKLFLPWFKLNDAELTSAYEHWLHYMDSTGTMARATAQGNLFPGNGHDAEDEPIFDDPPAPEVAAGAT